MNDRYEAIICGAGIAGVAAAYGLAQLGVTKILLVDRDAPLSLTSDKSTECYRNWWPSHDNAMASLMNRSIDLMEMHARQTNNCFQLNRRGYLFATADPSMVSKFQAQAERAEKLGVGAFRRIIDSELYQPVTDDGFDSKVDGADLITDRALINRYFPYLNSETKAVLHARRCGFLSAQQMGMYLLDRCREQGVEFYSAEFLGAETSAGRISAVRLLHKGAERRILCGAMVLSTGPYLKASGALLGANIPVIVERHVKITLPDHLGIIPRSAPLMIWSDSIDLPWSDKEKSLLLESPETQYLIETFRAGVHGRPTGNGNQVIMYWTFNCESEEEPLFPLDWDPYLPEITLRGMAVMVPGLEQYLHHMPKPYVDGGYYTKTRENRPLIGPLEIEGAFVCGAFSGYGIMAACGSGELLAKHVTGDRLPSYASTFMPARYDNPDYHTLLNNMGLDGQL